MGIFKVGKSSVLCTAQEGGWRFERVVVRLVFDYTKRFLIGKPAQLVQGKCDARGV